MRPSVRNLAVLLASVALFGCAPPSYILLKPEVTDRIKASHAEIIVPQEEINAEVQQSGIAAAGGGGLLLALIDVAVEASRADTANRTIEPIRKQLADVDFRKELSAKVRTALEDIKWLKVTRVAASNKVVSAEDRARMVAAMAEDSFLEVNSDYQLSADFRHLMVRTTANLWQRGQEAPQYLGHYAYWSAPISADKDKAAEQWAANNGAMLRAALREGINETVRMMQLDMVPTEATKVPAAPSANEKDVMIVWGGYIGGGFGRVKLGAVASEVMAKSGDRFVFRAKYPVGYVFSTTTHELFAPPTAVAADTAATAPAR